MNCEIFISYKCSDDRGNKTRDYGIARRCNVPKDLP